MESVVSSAYKIEVTTLEKSSRSILYTYIKKNIGPTIDPWGRPIVGVVLDERILPFLAHWDIFEKLLFRSLSGIPRLHNTPCQMPF